MNTDRSAPTAEEFSQGVDYLVNKGWQYCARRLIWFNIHNDSIFQACDMCKVAVRREIGKGGFKGPFYWQGKKWTPTTDGQFKVER